MTKLSDVIRANHEIIADAITSGQWNQLLAMLQDAIESHEHSASGGSGSGTGDAGGIDISSAVGDGVLSPEHGGTGVDNGSRTLTISTNSGTITFSSGGLTLTVPASGVAALLAVAQTFSALQTFSNGINVTGSASIKQSSAGNPVVERFIVSGTARAAGEALLRLSIGTFRSGLCRLVFAERNTSSAAVSTHFHAIASFSFGRGNPAAVSTTAITHDLILNRKLAITEDDVNSLIDIRVTDDTDNNVSVSAAEHVLYVEIIAVRSVSWTAYP